MSFTSFVIYASLLWLSCGSWLYGQVDGENHWSRFESFLAEQAPPVAFSFILSGHVRGPSTSVYPVTSLVANIDLLNKTSPDFMIVMGDLTYRGTPKELSLKIAG